MFGIGRQALPAGLPQLVEGRTKSLRGLDFVTGRVKAAALLIAGQIQRQQNLGGEAAALHQHLVDGVRVQIRVRRHPSHLVDCLQHFVQHELLISQRSFVHGHVQLLLLDFFESISRASPARARSTPSLECSNRAS